MRALLVGLLVVICTPPAGAQWRQLDGPRPPVVGALGTAGDVLLLATNEADQGGTWRSTDGGARWTHTGFAHGGGSSFLEVGGTVFQGVYLGGLWRSADAGASWESVPGISPSFTVAGLASSGDTLYAALDGGASALVARSFDGGTTWSLGGSGPSGRVDDVAALPGGAVVLARRTGGVLHSTDAGATWTATLGLPAGARVRTVVAHGSAFYALVLPASGHPGLWRSSDRGASWGPVGVPFSATWEPEDLTLSGDTVVAAVGRDGVRYSHNGGLSWLTPSGLPVDAEARRLLRTPGGLLLGSSRGVFRSTDGGATWSAFGQGSVGISTISALLADGGSLWQALSQGPSDLTGLWHSADRGASWTRRSEGLAGSGRVVGLVRHRGALYALAASLPRGVYRSDDDGLTWSPTSLAPGTASGFVALLADGEDRLFATTTTRTMFVSSDGGLTWHSVESPLGLRDIVRWNGHLLGASYGEGVWLSADGGLTWTPFGAGLPSPLYGTAFEVHDGALYLGTQTSGVYRLSGETWMGLGPSPASIEALASAPTGLLAIGHRTASGGVVRQLSGGTWVTLDDGLPEQQASHVLVQGDSVLVAGRHFGLWGRSLPGIVASEEPPSGRERFVVWPNPVRRGATVAWAGRRVVEVVDGLGRTVGRADGEAWRTPAGLAPGPYVLREVAGERAGIARLTVVP